MKFLRFIWQLARIPYMKISLNPAVEFTDYLGDESRRTGSADSIAFPESEDDIRAQLAWAAETMTPITVQSGRTGIAGGATPDGGRILNVSRMARIMGMRYDETRARFTVRVQPGVTLKALHDALAMHGSTLDTTGWDAASLAACARYRQGPPHVFPPDLTEAGACLGGVVANNGSGARSFRYGPARPHVLALRIVLPGGDVLALRRGGQKATGRKFDLSTLLGKRLYGTLPDYVMPAVKNAAGLYVCTDMDMIDLFIGAEGVLGVFSELELLLTPQPTIAWGLTAFLPSEQGALSFVEKIREDRRYIAAIEFFSAEALALLRARRADSPAFEGLPPLKPDWNTAVYVEFNGASDAEVESALGQACEMLEACGGNADDTWLATGRAGIETFKGVRHAVPEAVNLMISERKRQYPGITKLGTDLAVPDSRLREVMTMYHGDLRAAGLDYVIFGHIGNNHLHVNILPSTPDDYARGKALYLEWAGQVSAMGGTVSAEHGIGKLKTKMLEIMYGAPAIAQMRQVKAVFDPEGLINRGTLFQPDGH